MRAQQPILLFFMVAALVLAGCDIRGVSAPEAQQPALDYSWVATTPWAELAGHYDRHNAFIYKNYYERQKGYASGEIPPLLLPNAYSSHPLAYYTLKRDDVDPSARVTTATTATNTATLHFKRGLTYYDLGDFEGAITEFSRAIQLDDRHARAFAFRALSYGYTGNTARAQSDLQNAIRLKADPKLIAEVRRALQQQGED